jgi:exonuclease SbcD
VFDLRLMAGLSEGSDLLTVLTPQRPDVVFRDLDLVVYGRVAPGRRVARSPLADFSVGADTRASWRVAMIHGSLAGTGGHEDDDVVFTPDEVAASGLDYLALGHSHAWATGTAGRTTWASPGAVEALGPDQEDAGRVAIVELDERSRGRSVQVREAVVGRTRYSSLEIPAAEVASTLALVARLRKVADPNVVLDVTITGPSDHWLDIDPASLSRELEGSFLAVRVRDASSALPAAKREPVTGSFASTFVDILDEHLATAERTRDTEGMADGRAALALGRRLLDDPRQAGLI